MLYNLYIQFVRVFVHLFRTHFIDSVDEGCATVYVLRNGVPRGKEFEL